MRIVIPTHSVRKLRSEYILAMDIMFTVYLSLDSLEGGSSHDFRTRIKQI